MVKAVCKSMRLEYWARLRFRAGSWHVNVPAGEIKKLLRHHGLVFADLKGQEVKVEVSL